MSVSCLIESRMIGQFRKYPGFYVGAKRRFALPYNLPDMSMSLHEPLHQLVQGILRRA